MSKWQRFFVIFEAAFGIFHDLEAAGVVKVKEGPQIDAIHAIVMDHVVKTIVPAVQAGATDAPPDPTHTNAPS